MKESRDGERNTGESCLSTVDRYRKTWEVSASFRSTSKVHKSFGAVCTLSM